MTKKHAKLPRKANLPLTLNMIILCHLMAKDILGSHYVPNWALTPFGFMNNKGAGQPVHPRRLISAFVICYWKVPYLNLQQTKFQYFNKSQ